MLPKAKIGTRGKDGQENGRLAAIRDITERKQAEAVLHDSQARLTRILNQSPAGIVQTDASGRIILVNERWCEMLGYSKSEMLEMSVIDVTHSSSVAATVEHVTRLAEGGPDFQIEKKYVCKDGSILRCSSNVAGLRDAQGNYQGLLAVVLDMTKRLDAEDRLRESDRQHQFLLELSDRLHTASDPTAAMSAAAELFARHCSLPLVQYLTIDPDGDRFVVSARYSDGWLPDALRQSGRLSDHGPDWGPQFRNGEAVFSDDHDDRPEADASASRALNIRSGSAVPLLRNGRLVAMFTSANHEPRNWTAAEKSLQHEVAQRTWAAVERASAEAAVHVAHDTFRHLVDRSPLRLEAKTAGTRTGCGDPLAADESRVIAPRIPLLSRNLPYAVDALTLHVDRLFIQSIGIERMAIARPLTSPVGLFDHRDAPCCWSNWSHGISRWPYNRA